MKRVLLSVSVVCLLAGQASAASYYTPDLDTALAFTEDSVSGGFGLLLAATTDTTVYGGGMQLDVGYMGYLSYPTTVLTVGAGSNLGMTESFDGFQALFANDDADDWDVQLFLKATSSATPYYSGWTSIPVGDTALLTLAVPFDFDNVLDFGFEVSGSGDVFHLSMAVVPTPVAVMLGVLGLGVAGLKLRKYA